MKIVLGLLLSLSSVWAAPSGDEGQIWAVLVAGSNEYYNYRHQADICHAYQIFHRHGVPDSNIIVMMYDDVANSPENPHKGVIINQPNGPNVYKKVPKDYTKKQVTPDNFISVLTGDSKGVEGTGSGKVLKSGPNDHVFIYFADHGSTGLIAFPDEYLYANDLIKALKTMNEKKMYKKLVFYMEACESGSMFKNILPKNIDIFATTAANPSESSYACYWDEDLQTYLGDEYSVAWMEDVDSEEHQTNITTETLKVQFKNVVKRVTQSHPSMWGEKPIQKDLVKDFIGASQGGRPQSKHQKTVEPFTDSVSARDVLLHTLNRKLQSTNSLEEKKELQKKRDDLINGRMAIDRLFAAIVNHVTDSDEDDISDIVEERHDLSEDMMSCYKSLVDTFNKQCVNINKNTYALAHLYKFANLCATEYTSIDKVLEAMEAKCDATHNSMEGVH